MRYSSFKIFKYNNNFLVTMQYIAAILFRYLDSDVNLETSEDLN